MIYILFLSMIITDLPLSLYIGTIGLSPMIIIALLFFLIYILFKNKVVINYTSKLFFYYYLITLINSFLICIVFFMEHNVIYDPYGNLIFIKLVKTSTNNLIYVLVYILIFNLLIRKNLLQIKRIFLLFFLITVFIAFLEKYDKNILSIFHVVSVDYNRLRLLTSEPSRAALQVVILGGISMFFVKSFYFFLILFISFILLILIASKGSFIFIIISLFLSVFFFKTNLIKKLKIVFYSFIMIGASGYIFILYILPHILIDIDKFTSFSTRIITYLWAFISLLHFPLGEGYGTYLIFFKQPLIEAKNFISSVFPISLNYSEIDNMLLTGKNVAVKSGLLFQIVLNGVFAIIFYFLLFKKTFYKIYKLNINYKNKLILIFLLYYTLFTILFGANIEVLYIYILPIIFIDVLYYCQSEYIRIKNE